MVISNSLLTALAREELNLFVYIIERPLKIVNLKQLGYTHISDTFCVYGTLHLWEH